MNKQSLLLSLGLIFLLPGITSAGIYRWVDENGKVHFSDRPVDKENAEEMALPNQQPLYRDESVNQQERQIKQKKMLDMYDDERRQKAKERVEKKQQEAERKQHEQRCAYAKDDLRRYQGRALYVPLPDGGRRFLSEEERAKEIAELEANIKKYCR